MGTGRQIIKNFASLVTTDFIVKAIGFAVAVYLARKLEPDDFGILTFSLSIVNYFTYFTDPGITTYGVKKAAQAPEEMSAHMNDIFTIRLVLTAAAMALVAASAFFMHQPPLVKFILLAYSLSMLPQALTPTWIYQGVQKMEFVGLHNITHSLVYSGLVFAFVAGPGQLKLIPFFLAAAYFTASASFLLPLLRRYGFRFRKVRLSQALEAVRHSLPIGVSTFLVAGINWNLSTTLLGFLSDKEQVGYFAIAMKIALIIMGGGIAFGITLLPLFSRHHYSSKPTAEKILSLSQKAIALAGVPLVFGTIATGGYLLNYVFGAKYSDSGPVLSLIIPGAVLYTLNAVYYVYLISEEKQVRNMWISIARALLLLSASALLIPGFGAQGAAAAYTLSELLIAAVYIREIRLAPDLPHGPAALFLKPLAAAAGMFILISLVPAGWALLKIPLGALVYAAIIFAIKGVRPEEIRKLTGYFKKEGSPK